MVYLDVVVLNKTHK